MLGVHKGRRQPDFCVTYYALAREPLNDLHGFFINVGTYDTEKEAEAEAKRIRLELKNTGGRVRVHMTGHPEGLLGDDAKYGQNKKLVSDDIHSMHSIKQQEEAEKRRLEKQQIEQRRKELELEQQLYDDPNSLESYAQLHVRRRMMEETIVAQVHNLNLARKKMEELRAEITERDRVTPTFKDEWRGLIKSKIGTDQVFILKERTNPEAPAVDVEDELRRVVESAASASSGAEAAGADSGSSSCPAVSSNTE